MTVGFGRGVIPGACNIGQIIARQKLAHDACGMHLMSRIWRREERRLEHDGRLVASVGFGTGASLTLSRPGRLTFLPSNVRVASNGPGQSEHHLQLGCSTRLLVGTGTPWNFSDPVAMR